MRPCSVVSKPMPARVMAAAIRDGSSAPERSAGRSASGRSTVCASHAKWSSARLRLAVRIRGEARDQPDGVGPPGARPHAAKARVCFENAARALPHCAGIWLQRYWTWRGVRVYDCARWPTRPCSIRSEFSRSSFEPMFPFPLRKRREESYSRFRRVPARPSSLPAFRSLLY